MGQLSPFLFTRTKLFDNKGRSPYSIRGASLWMDRDQYVNFPAYSSAIRKGFYYRVENKVPNFEYTNVSKLSSAVPSSSTLMTGVFLFALK
jgi:hypothetical protein